LNYSNYYLKRLLSKIRSVKFAVLPHPVLNKAARHRQTTRQAADCGAGQQHTIPTAPCLRNTRHFNKRGSPARELLCADRNCRRMPIDAAR
jgi:hypothetical protein